jgi:hypothetical protein
LEAEVIALHATNNQCRAYCDVIIKDTYRKASVWKEMHSVAPHPEPAPPSGKPASICLFDSRQMYYSEACFSVWGRNDYEEQQVDHNAV